MWILQFEREYARIEHQYGGRDERPIRCFYLENRNKEGIRHE